MKTINQFLQHTRHPYNRAVLSENHLNEDPLKQFESWMHDAIMTGIPEPNAMDLCTVSGKNPSNRIVLLKGVDERGFIFYTNYASRKGKEMIENPFVSVNFFWQQLTRQVRIEGEVEKVPGEESDAYFQSRPRESQIGAWASIQSSVLASREELENRLKVIDNQYRNEIIPRPPHWGGFVIKPFRIEFWQGRENRLHDRFLYELTDTNWNACRLSP